MNPALSRSKLQAKLRCPDQSCASLRDLGLAELKTLIRDHGLGEPAQARLAGAAGVSLNMQS